MRYDLYSGRLTSNVCSNSQQSQPSQHHHREAPQVYELERGAGKDMATEKGLCYTTSAIVLSTTGIIPYKLRDCLKVRNIRPVLYILMQKAVILKLCRMNTMSV